MQIKKQNMLQAFIPTSWVNKSNKIIMYFC